MLTIDQIEKVNTEMMRESSFTTEKGKTIRVNEAKQKNKIALQRAVWESEEVKYLRESSIKKLGFDLADSKAFPVMDDRFSWKKVSQKYGYNSLATAFREADNSTGFVQVLRAGSQAIANNMYQSVPTTFESWTTTVQSKRDTELYPPLQGLAFLTEVGQGEIYGETRAAGLDLKLSNRKFGVIYPVTMELLEDDQTGQFAQQTALIAEYCKLAVECYVYAKVAGKFTGGALAQYAGLIIPNSETQPSPETTWPFTTSFVQGGGANRPASYGALNQTNIQNGFIGLMNQKNILGLKMSVDPDTILIGPKYRFDLAVLLNSSFYPSQPGNAGTTGTSFAINPIESIAKAVVTRFMFKNDGTVDGTSGAWYLLDSKKPFFIVQMREAVSIVQEAPNAGTSFDRDIIRYKGTTRFNCDYIDSRFIWQGSDGSV